MIEKLKTDATLAYQQLISIGLGKYSRGIVSVISRDTGTPSFSEFGPTSVLEQQSLSNTTGMRMALEPPIW